MAHPQQSQPNAEDAICGIKNKISSKSSRALLETLPPKCERIPLQRLKMERGWGALRALISEAARINMYFSGRAFYTVNKYDQI